MGSEMCIRDRHYDAHDFVEDLLQVPWYENSLIGDVNGKVKHFDANFGSVLDRHAPIKNMKIRYRQCPFMNQEINHQMRIRDELHKIVRVTKLPVNWNNFYRQRNEVKNMLRNAEKHTYRVKFEIITAIRTPCGKSLGSVCRAEKLHRQ